MIGEKNNKKNKVIKGIALLGLFLMVFGISYALFRVTLNGKKTTKIKTGKFDLLITDPGTTTLETDGVAINDQNAIPKSSLEGMETTPYNFDLYNPGDYPVKYTLYLKVPEKSNNISNDKVKYSLKRKDSNIVISSIQYNNMNYEGKYIEGSSNTDDESFKAIYNSLFLSDVYEKDEVKDSVTYKLYKMDLGVIGPKQRQQYEYKMWISYNAGMEVDGKELEAKMKVVGEQTKKYEAYPVEVVNVTTDEEGQIGLQSLISMYSDKSIRVETATKLSSEKSEKVLTNWMYNTDENMSLIKEACLSFVEENKTLMGDEYDTIKALVLENSDSYYDFRKNILDDELPNYGLTQDLYDVIGGYIENNEYNIENYIFSDKYYNGDFYYNTDATILGESDVAGLPIKNLYLTNGIAKLHSSSLYLPILETLTFLEIDDRSGIDFSLYPIRGLTRLKEVILPSNLESISGSCNDSNKSNITIKIRANKVNVSYDSSELEGFKSVEWLNN